MSSPPAGKYSNAFADVVDVSTINEDLIVSSMAKLEEKFTSAHDQVVPASFVRNCRYVFSAPLSILFKLALRTLTFPNVWKTARICPILKAGTASEISNYRPIAIISNFFKYTNYVSILIFIRR